MSDNELLFLGNAHNPANKFQLLSQCITFFSLKKNE